jgi:hypothetical protein
MTDFELDPIVERIAREARRPVAADPDARERLHAVIRAELGSDRASGQWNSSRTRAVSLTMPRFAALAAGLVGIGVLVGMGSNLGRGSRLTGQPSQVVDVQRPPASESVVMFVFPAPSAERVSVVGDFNGWDTAATPMKRIGNTDYWSVTVPMSVGRHIFSYFAVTKDGERWSADPTRPSAPDDGFGRANSVVLVGTGSAS